MPIKFKGLLEDVDTYEGKNGFGANITVSTKVGKKIKRIEFNNNNKQQILDLEKLIGDNVEIEVELNQNKFGIRFGEIITFNKVK